MTTTYCTRADIETIISAAGLLACIDDDESKDESATESTFVTKAISNAASKLNQALTNTKYKLSSLSGNEWVKWTNAYLAADVLMRRRGNPPLDTIASEIKERLDLLLEIRAGRAAIPEQTPDFDCLPTVSNFRPELYKWKNPVRVSTDESTGPNPDKTRQRNNSGDLSPY